MSRLSKLWLVLGVLCASGSTAQAFLESKTINQTISGQSMTFTFDNLPEYQSGGVTVRVYLYGDYDASSETASVTIDNVYKGVISGGTPQCNTWADSNHTGTYSIASTYLGDDKLVVKVNIASTVSAATCSSSSPHVRVTVSYTAAADLRVVSSTAPKTGSTAGAGSQFTVRYTLRNSYQTLTTNFSVRFKLCPSTSGIGCSTLGTQYISDNFLVDQERTFDSPTLTLPDSVERGTRQVRIEADPYNSVDEADEGNNYRYDSIYVSDKPDLRFVSSTVPYSGSVNNVGSSFTGRYCIAADANKTAVKDTFEVRYKYCPANVASNCTLLGKQNITHDIDSGETYCYTSMTLQIPSTATQGNRYIRATLDRGYDIDEDDEGNNEDFDLIYIGVGAQPDLELDNLTVPLVGSVNAAGSAFMLQCRVRNTSGVTVSTNFKLAYEYCLTPASSACAQLGSDTVTKSVEPWGSFYKTSSQLKMPVSAKLGNAYIRVTVDSEDTVGESDEQNNEAQTQVSVTTKPDLTVSAPAPQIGATGDFVLQATVDNSANTSAFTSNFQLAYYYCDTQVAGSCTKLGEDAVTHNFDSGESYSFTSSSLKLPGTAKPGTHYLRLQVDAQGAVAEGNEANNDHYVPVVINKAGPDLYVKSFWAQSSGADVTYNVEICNYGSGTSDTFDVGFYLQSNGAPQCGSSPDMTVNVTGLGQQACRNLRVVQNNVLGASYNTWVLVDQGCSVAESNEQNNTASTPVTVVGQPDAGVTDSGVDPKDDGQVTPIDAAIYLDHSQVPGADAGPGIVNPSVPTQSGCSVGDGRPAGSPPLTLLLLVGLCALLGRRRRDG